MFGAFRSNKDNKNMFKIAFQQIFEIFNMNPRKIEGFLIYIPCIPSPEYGQSNSPQSRNEIFSEQNNRPKGWYK